MQHGKNTLALSLDAKVAGALLNDLSLAIEGIRSTASCYVMRTTEDLQAASSALRCAKLGLLIASSTSDRDLIWDWRQKVMSAQTEVHWLREDLRINKGPEALASIDTPETASLSEALDAAIAQFTNPARNKKKS